MGPKWGSDVARNGLLSFVHGAPLVPSAQAMPPADGFEGPEAQGLFLRMRIVWRGRFCTKIGVFNRGYVGKDRAYPPLPEPRACLPPWTENMVSKLYPKRPGPLKVGWGLRHMLGRDMLCFS